VDLPSDVRKDYGVWMGGNEVASVEGRKDIGGNVKFIISARGKECLLGTKIKKSEASRVLDLVWKSILLFEVGLALGRTGLCNPLIIPRSIFLQPKNEVTVKALAGQKKVGQTDGQILGTTLDK
jgi:hypothetical protein